MLLGIKRDVWREVVIDSDAQTGASADMVKEELLSATYKVFPCGAYLEQSVGRTTDNSANIGRPAARRYNVN